MLRGLLGLLGAALLAPAAQAQDGWTLRIGFQKYGTLTIVKALGTLDKRLAEQGVTVKWTEFPAGPQLLEGLNVGSIDFGTVGEAPPIFAQAAGAALVYVGSEPAAPASEAILVPGFAAARVADLKGRKVALNKGSNVHYLLVKQLERAGVAYRDVNVVYLTPSDARAAFERGAIDAWVIWDPFQAAAEKQLGGARAGRRRRRGQELPVLPGRQRLREGASADHPDRAGRSAQGRPVGARPPRRKRGPCCSRCWAWTARSWSWPRAGWPMACSRSRARCCWNSSRWRTPSMRSSSSPNRSTYSTPLHQY